MIEQKTEGSFLKEDVAPAKKGLRSLCKHHGQSWYVGIHMNINWRKGKKLFIEE